MQGLSSAHSTSGVAGTTPTDGPQNTSGIQLGLWKDMFPGANSEMPETSLGDRIGAVFDAVGSAVSSVKEFFSSAINNIIDKYKGLFTSQNLSSCLQKCGYPSK